MKLPRSYYLNEQVTAIARDLLGKVLVCRHGKKLVGAMIVETEAYSYKEKGCHAYNSKRTARTSVMFMPGGHAYVYLCYGIHHLFNVVTNRKGMAEAVLVRSVEPIEGIADMLQRTNQLKISTSLTSGPGKLTRAMGISLQHNAADLCADDIWIEDRGIHFNPKEIKASTRIGIAYAGADARLPWRFIVKDNAWLSMS
jgi:DNA-3-methyladenine glycosylase